MLYTKEVFEASYSYERYMGRIKLKEAPSDVTVKSLADHQSPQESVIKRETVNRRLDVANTEEEKNAKVDHNAPESFYK